MNTRQINRAIAIWLAFPAAPTGTLSGVLSYSEATEGVQFHSYGELMSLLGRLATGTPGVDSEAPALRLAS